MALLNGVFFIGGVTELPSVYLLATLMGNSILVDIYMLVTSLRMCVWYKLNLVCLLAIQVSGLLYNYCMLGTSVYSYVSEMLDARRQLFAPCVMGWEIYIHL